MNKINELIYKYQLYKDTDKRHEYTSRLLEAFEKEHYIIDTTFDTLTFGYCVFNPNATKDYYSDWEYGYNTKRKAVEQGIKDIIKLYKKNNYEQNNKI